MPPHKAMPHKAMPHKAILLAALSVLAATACSRLTFIKPDLARKGYQDEIARPVDLRPDRSDRRSSQLSKARGYLGASQKFLQAGDDANAEQQARLALKADPKSADAHTLLAVIEGRRGRVAKAGGHYRQAAELAPNNGSTLNNYGAWLCGSDRAAESLAWFDRALRDPAYPSPASALANAGSCALKSGQAVRAERDSRAALQLDPGNPVALVTMAESAFRASRFFEARAFSERRLTASPPDADALLLASQIEMKLGDRVAADRYVRRLRAEFPDASAAYPPGSETP